VSDPFGEEQAVQRAREVINKDRICFIY
jgi:hypothetical protein